MKKDEYIKKLWNKKHPADILLAMYPLIENADQTEDYKNKVYAVMKGILAYLERGDVLMGHHRTFLYNEWKFAWESQKDDSVKVDIKQWLME